MQLSNMKTFILLSLATAALFFTESLGAKWDYHGPLGPHHWHAINGSYCGGKSQSPINIVETQTIETDMGEFIFEGLYGFRNPVYPGQGGGQGGGGQGGGQGGWNNGWGNGGNRWGNQGNGWGNGGRNGWWNNGQPWSNPFGNLRMPNRFRGPHPTVFGMQGPTDVMLPSDNHIPNVPRTPQNYRYGPTRPVTVSNDGHTLKVGLDDYYVLKGGALPTAYKPLQLHFHWGTTHDQGSEHTINGRAYAAELHLVHYNSQYKIPDEAMTQPGGLAVLGFFIEAVDYDNPAFDPLLDTTENVRFKGAEILYRAHLPLREMLPGDLSNYYRYNGSLTVPMCYESVIWTVFTEPIRLSHSQLDMFRELYQGLVVEPNGQLEPLLIEDNFRPTQPLFGRRVLRSVPRYGGPNFGRSKNAAGTLLPAKFLLLLSAVVGAVCRVL